MFDPFVADLGYVNQSGHAVAQIDKGAVRLQAFYLSFHNSSYLDLADPLCLFGTLFVAQYIPGR